MVFLSRPREAQLTTSDPLYSAQSTPLLHISSILTDMIDAYFCRCNGLESKRQTFLAKHTLRLFSPRPPPSFGSWQRAQRRGDRATSANWRVGRASYLLRP